MTRHFHADELLDYLHGHVDVAQEQIESHVSACVQCSSLLRDLKEMTELLADPDVWTMADARPEAGEVVIQHALRVDRELCKDLLAKFMPFQPDRVAAYLAIHPEGRSEAFVRHAIDHAVSELDRDSALSLAILDRVDGIASHLPGRNAVPEYRAEIWKNRANALRMLGRYEEALEATAVAREFAKLSPTGNFVMAQICAARGLVLFKMGRYSEAAAEARDAAMQMAEFGDVGRVAQARMLEAVARAEQGDLDGALEIYVMIRPHLERLGDLDGVARVTANVAVTRLRLNEHTLAREAALEARDRYIQLGSESEATRTEWIVGAIDLAEGDTEGGVRRMLRAAAGFETLRMLADSAFVKLDLTEEFLRLERFDDAERFARDAAETFARSGGKLHLMRALSYLREAVARREVTAALVRYVKAYIRADNPGLPFRPEEVAG